MDIEERADKYAEDNAPIRCDGKPLPPEQRMQMTAIVRDAYLAGSAQTQADYVAHYSHAGRM